MSRKPRVQQLWLTVIGASDVEVYKLTMQIWKLQPIDPDDPSWKAQDFKGPFIVRAENEARARRKVFLRTAQLAPLVGKTSFGSPWTTIEKTTCDPCLDSGLSPDGPEEILWPKDDT
jgi:hypothetical protein